MKSSEGISNSIVFFGDLSLHGVTEKDEFLFSEIEEILENNIIVANLESPFESDQDTSKDHKIVINAKESVARMLRDVDAVSLANNHISDLGENSVSKTMKLLEKNNVKYGGYVNNLNESRQPLVINFKGSTIHILFYSCLSTNGENYARGSGPGVPPLAFKNIMEDINNSISNGANNIVVSIHWGVENEYMPTIEQVAFARKIIDAGADLIWSHHTHSIQPFEQYKGKIISYGLGNFLFNDIVDKNGELIVQQKQKNRESMALVFGIDDGGKLSFRNMLFFRYCVDRKVRLVVLKDIEAPFERAVNILKETKATKHSNDLSMKMVFNGNMHQVHYVDSPITLKKKYTMNKIKNFVYKNLKYYLMHVVARAVLKNDILYTFLRFHRTFGYFPNLFKPRTYSEKINYIKLFGRNNLQKIVADKFEVRKYVKDKIGDKYLNEIYNLYENVNDVLICDLPESFVMKATHGSGWNEIVYNKNTINTGTLVEKCSNWLTLDYYDNGREWCYKNIVPRILAEKLILDENGNIPVDYKFHCLNGKMQFMQIDISRFDKQKRVLFDRDFKRLDVQLHYQKYEKLIKLPKNIKEMLKVAEKLAKDFLIVRVDLYSVENNIIFGELTNYPGNGFEKFTPEKYDFYFGDLLNVKGL